MWEINDTNWNSHWSSTERNTIMKHCPVCGQIFNLDELRLMAYCEECDTDYYFSKNKILPYKTVVYAHERKKCHCEGCKARRNAGLD